MMLNPGDGSGLVDEINDICHSDNNSYPLTSKVRRLNAGLDWYLVTALQANESFHFDDSTRTDLPIGFAEIKSGFDNTPYPADLLQIREVFIKDSDGQYNQIYEETTPNEVFKLTQTGRPTAFKLVGGSLLWNKIPDYTQADGVMIHFSRAMERFVPTDTTKEPGIPVIFHTWLAEYASLPELAESTSSYRQDIQNRVDRGEIAIKNYHANRNKTRKPRLGVSQWETNR